MQPTAVKTAVIGLIAAIVFPALAHPAVPLLDRNDNPVMDQLDNSNTITAANGSVYAKGPAYSPEQTCGRCHDYNSITKAFHFREGA